MFCLQTALQATMEENQSQRCSNTHHTHTQTNTHITHITHTHTHHTNTTLITLFSHRTRVSPVHPWTATTQIRARTRAGCANSWHSSRCCSLDVEFVLLVSLASASNDDISVINDLFETSAFPYSLPSWVWAADYKHIISSVNVPIMRAKLPRCPICKVSNCFERRFSPRGLPLQNQHLLAISRLHSADPHCHSLTNQRLTLNCWSFWRILQLESADARMEESRKRIFQIWTFEREIKSISKDSKENWC